MHRDVPAGRRDAIGTPAMAGDESLRALAAIRRLPELLKDVRSLGRRMAALETAGSDVGRAVGRWVSG